VTFRSLGWTTAGWRCRAILFTAILVALAAIALGVKPRANDVQADAKPRPSYGRLPIMFEPNHGQTAEPVRFLARGAGYGLFLTKSEAVIVLRDVSKSDRSLTESVVRMKLANANADPALSGDDPLPGKSNYLLGNDPSKWHRGIPQFARVRYQGIYPGVDLVYYGRQGSLEYDFAIAPGSDPNQIKLRFEGANSLTIAYNGDLQLNLPASVLRLLAPRVYQKFGAEEKPVAAKFQLLADNQVAFALGAYDHSRELIIDPTLTYSTYLGGSGTESCSTITGLIQTPGCPGIAVDTSNNAYVAGSTTSTNFPVISGSFQLSPTAGFKANVFVSKFNGTGSALTYSTYLGGDGLDYTAGIAVDLAGNAYVAGTTTSTNFPTHGLNAPFQATPLTTGKHSFFSVLNGSGSALIYSTYLSGNGADVAAGIALDPSANAYITGTTTSTEIGTGFPSTVGAYQIRSNAATQVYLTKIDAASAGPASVLYSTYFGGSSPSTGTIIAGGIAVDTDANAYITGSTTFDNLPVLDAYQGTPLGGFDAFVAKFNPTAVSGSQLVYSTYLGGPGNDFGYGIAVDTSFFAYVTGATNSTDDFGITQVSGTTSFQPLYQGGPSDAYIAKLGIACTGTSCVNTTVPLSYFTYVGGAGTDVGTAITVDTIGGPRITGWTNSTNFPVVNNRLAQTSYGGGNSDAFITRVDTTATIANAPGDNSAYFGGNGTDIGDGLAIDTQGANYMSGETSSTSGFPLLNAFQPALSGTADAFVSKLGPYLNVTVNETGTPSPVGVGNQVSFAYTVTNGFNTQGVISNPGDYVSGVTFTDTLPSTGVATFISATGPASSSCPAQPTNGIIVCNLGALNSGTTATVTVVLTPVAPVTPNTGPVLLGNTATVGIYGTTYNVSPNPSASVFVNDFTLAVAPPTVTVPAGVPASYTVTLTPTGNIPDAVTLACASGLPSGAKCTIVTNPLPNLSTGAASTTLVINTTARITTTTEFWKQRPLYAAFLPISGLALLGAGVSGKKSWKKRLVLGLLFTLLFSVTLFLPACSSGTSVTTTTGTPAGTYAVTVSATTGTAVRNQVVTLVVQ
jgi:hypothetical protein